MDFGYAIFKGVLQGLTEFLPVSSTAHLVFTDALAKYFGFYKPQVHGEEEFFNILVQMGTLLAVVYYFRADLWHLVQGCLGKSESKGFNLQVGGLDSQRLVFHLGLSTALTIVLVLGVLKSSEVAMSTMGLAALGVTDISEFFFRYPEFVAVHLIVTGCMLFFTERFSKGARAPRFTLKNSVTIGLAQMFSAVFHGMSRSGTTISAGLASGLDRLTATRYSFLLSLPTLSAATAYDAMKFLKSGTLFNFDWPAMLLGAALAGVVGYFCVKYFIQFVARNSLNVFAIYCWVVGLMMFFFFKNGAGFVRRRTWKFAAFG